MIAMQTARGQQGNRIEKYQCQKDSATTLPRREVASANSLTRSIARPGCPTLAAFLFLRLGWDRWMPALWNVGNALNGCISLKCVFRSMWAPDSIRSGHQFLFDVGSNSVVMWAAFSDLP
jgi:hypothetical protein